MRKKLVALLLVVVLLCGVLSGCSLFSKNEERDYNVVIAEVTYKDYKAVVTKGEFLEYFAQYAEMYQQYYGWDIDKMFEEFTKTLAKKELLVLMAKDHYKVENINFKDANFNTLEYKAIFKSFGFDEQKFVLDATNKQFQEAYDTRIKEYDKDDLANIGKDDEDEDVAEDKDKIDPRPVKSEEEEDTTFKADSTITATDIPEKFVDVTDKKNDNNELSKNQKKAYKSIMKSLSDQYKSYDYFMRVQSESRLLSKYKEELNNKVATPTDEELDTLYNYEVVQSVSTIFDSASYKTKVETNDGSLILNHQAKDYSRVKSILLKFSPAQEAILKSIQSTNADNTSAVKNFRDILARGGNAEDFGWFGTTGIKVNISNPDYDPDAECELENCECIDCNNHKCVDEATCIHKNEKNEKITCRQQENKTQCECVACPNNAYTRYDVDYAEIIGLISADLLKAENDLLATDEYKNADSIKQQLLLSKAIVEAFENWIWMVNDDPGMFEGKEYTVTPDGETSSYVKEFTDLARALTVNGGVGNYGLENVAEDGTLIGGKDDKDKDKTRVYQKDGLAFIVNDFGIHIIIISSMPLDTNLNNEEIKTDLSDDALLAGDYQIAEVKKMNIKTGKEETFYRVGNKFILGLNDKDEVEKVYDRLKKTVDDENKADSYSKEERAFFKEYEEKSIKYFDKKIAKIKKQLEKSIA